MVQVSTAQNVDQGTFNMRPGLIMYAHGLGLQGVRTGPGQLKTRPGTVQQAHGPGVYYSKCRPGEVQYETWSKIIKFIGSKAH